MWEFGFDRCHERLLAIIPFARRETALCSDPGIRAIGTYQQLTLQTLATTQFKLRDVFAFVVYKPVERKQHIGLIQRHIANVRECFGKHGADKRILDDITEAVGMYFVSTEVNCARAISIPHLHVLIRTHTQLRKCFPYAERR